jgi:hypothetical protein
MDGRGRWRDNIFIERLWKTVKYEDIYLKAYGSIPDVRQGLKAFFERYNSRRCHQALDDRIPDDVCLLQYAAGERDGMIPGRPNHLRNPGCCLKYLDHLYLKEEFEGENMQVPDEVRKCVGFVCYKNNKGIQFGGSIIYVCCYSKACY